MLTQEQLDRAHQANIARLKQLSQDALDKSQETPERHDYYLGLSDGLYRAINVLEGRG